MNKLGGNPEIKYMVLEHDEKGMGRGGKLGTAKYEDKGMPAYMDGKKKSPLEVGDEPKISNKKNFDISMHRKGIGRIKEGSNREKNRGTRTGLDKVAVSAGTHLAGKEKRRVVTEKKVNNSKSKGYQKMVKIG